MRYPQWEWVRQDKPSETVRLVCVGSSLELGAVTRKTNKSGKYTYSGLSYITDGVYGFDTLEEAKAYVERVGRREFMKMRETV